MTERNPYLILGIDYGASKAEAARGFARATRRLRDKSEPPYDLEDLNWALHQIEQRIDNPDLSLDDFRYPADPSAFELPSGYGLLNPRSVPFPRQSEPTTEDELRQLRNRLVKSQISAVRRHLDQNGLPVLHSFDPHEEK